MAEKKTAGQVAEPTTPAPKPPRTAGGPVARRPSRRKSPF